MKIPAPETVLNSGHMRPRPCLKKSAKGFTFIIGQTHGGRFSITEWLRTIPGRPQPGNTFSFTNRCLNDAAQRRSSTLETVLRSQVMSENVREVSDASFEND